MEKITYENFEIIINNGKKESIDKSLKCSQRYYIRYLFKNRIANDKISTVEYLKNQFGNDATHKLTDNDISIEKMKMY